MRSFFPTLALLLAARSEFPLEQECPEDCDCHYFRVNYVTDCSESNFTEIPYDEISMNVFILDMNGNQISEVQPFPEDIKIRRLQLAENKLTEVTAEMFSGLRYMLDVDLSGNMIRTVDPDAFRDSHGLVNLELQNNPLSSQISGTFLRCGSLLYLDLSNCNLTDLGEEFFSGTPLLTYLDLSSNPFSTLSPKLFTPLMILEELRLSHCNLSHLDPTLLTNQHNLKVLDLSYNCLTAVDWVSVFGGLHRLENLNLRETKIRTLPGFANNSQLRHLTLSNNEMSDLDIFGDNLKNLVSLDLSNCNLIGPLDQNAFANASSLKILNLSGNRLTSHDLSAPLNPLKKLTTLTLSNCSLSRLSKDSFDNLTQLRELDISRNPLNNVFDELLDSLMNLEYLNIGLSNLTHLSGETFSRTRNLRRLILSGNQLGRLETGLLRNLRHLEVLEMENCGLSSAIGEEVFHDQSYGELRELKMSGNPLEIKEGSIIPEQLSKLRVLDLSKCNLSHLPDDAFVNGGNLRRLLLNRNRFGSEFMKGAKFLDNLSSLEYIDLSSNNMSVLPVRVIAELSLLREVKLTDNPWICECTLAEWWNWAVDKGDISHLIGSTLSAEDITKKGTKRKKGLLCTYHANLTPPTKRNSTRKSKTKLEPNIRTWSRYLKESNCYVKQIPPQPEAHTFFPEPILPSPQPAPFVFEYVDEPENEVSFSTVALSWAIICTAFFAVIAASLYISIRMINISAPLIR